MRMHVQTVPACAAAPDHQSSANSCCTISDWLVQATLLSHRYMCPFRRDMPLFDVFIAWLPLDMVPMSWLGGWQLFWDWFLLWQRNVENGTSSLCGCFSFKTWDSHVRHVPVDQLKVRGITILLVPDGYAQRKTMWDGSHWHSLNINSNIWTLRPKYPLKTHVDPNHQFQTQSQNDRIFSPQGTRYLFSYA